MVFYSHSSFNGCRLSDGISKRNSPGVQNYRVLPSSDQLRLSSSLQLLSSHFPFPPSSVTAASDPNDLLAFLPMPEEMLETYWCNFSMWCVYVKIYVGSDILKIPINRHTPVHRHQFQMYIYEPFYPHGIPKRHMERSDSHRLGVLFITLALGVLTDSLKPMRSVEAETYYRLARAAYVQTRSVHTARSR